MAVEGRLEFIKTDMYVFFLCIEGLGIKEAASGMTWADGSGRRKRVEKQIQEMQTESESKKMEV